MFSIKPTVFISSTISDLANERQAARLAIKHLGCVPVTSEESFIAQNRNSIDVCLKEVAKADIYILLLGGRYGFELEDGISITEKEWYTADQESKPILVFNLSNYGKELKQIEFANKVGNIYSGKFWKDVSDVFTLKDEIEKSLRNLLIEEEFKRKTNTEKVYSSLLNVSFPQKVYLADLTIDRKTIIANSINSESRLTQKASNREVVFAAMRQRGLKFASDWVSFNKKLLSFHDISSSQCPLSHLIDVGTVDELSSQEFYSIDNDYNNIFKALLGLCLKQKLYKMKVEWIHAYRHFRFMPIDETLSKRVVRWHSKKDATRTVFEQKKWVWNEKTYYECKHFAFKANFFEIDSRWYLNIVPDWAFTFDGRKALFAESDKIAYLKKNEHNQHVFNHLKFVYHFLRYNDSNSLFNKGYPFLEFGDIVNFNSFPKLYDSEWAANENADIKSNLYDKDQVMMEF
jgi:hypothetical protein